MYNVSTRHPPTCNISASWPTDHDYVTCGLMLLSQSLYQSHIPLLQLLVDDLLVYNGVLGQLTYGRGILPNTLGPQNFHTVLFTNDAMIKAKVKHTVVRYAECSFLNKYALNKTGAEVLMVGYRICPIKCSYLYCKNERQNITFYFVGYSRRQITTHTTNSTT